MSALRRRLDCDGLVLLEDALDPDRVTRLASAVDRIWRERGSGSALHLLGFVGLDESFVELVDHPAALPLVCEVLGCNVFVYHCHLDVHRPLERRPAAAWRWHQDGGRQNVELDAPRPQLSLKVAYFLTDVDEPEQGAMWFSSGRAQPSSSTAGSGMRAGTTSPAGRGRCSSTPTRTVGFGHETTCWAWMRNSSCGRTP